MEFKSQSMMVYYSKHPYEYDLKFIHNNLDLLEHSVEEYRLLELDLEHMKAEIKESFLVYFSELNHLASVYQNSNIVSKYTRDIYVRIRNADKYKAYQSFHLDLNVIVELKDLKAIDFKDDRIVLQINCVSELPLEFLDDIFEHYNVQKIMVGQIAYITYEFTDFLEYLSDKFGVDQSNQLELEKNARITNDMYDVVTYKRIIDEMHKMIEKYTGSKEERFRTLFYHLAESLVYDYDDLQTTKIENHNLIGSLFYRKSVCEGNSKFLQQLCSLLEIDAICVSGHGHVWNQVCIHNNWYNADLTSQAWSINERIGKSFYLIADTGLVYQSLSPFRHICNKDYEG